MVSFLTSLLYGQQYAGRQYMSGLTFSDNSRGGGTVQPFHMIGDQHEFQNVYGHKRSESACLNESNCL